MYVDEARTSRFHDGSHVMSASPDQLHQKNRASKNAPTERTQGLSLQAKVIYLPCRPGIIKFAVLVYHWPVKNDATAVFVHHCTYTTFVILIINVIQEFTYQDPSLPQRIWLSSFDRKASVR